MVEGLAQGTRGLLDKARGAPAAARERFALAREHLGPDASISWTGPIDAGAAELELWDDRPEAARAVVDRALARARGPGRLRSTWRGCCGRGVRAEADLAERARAPADPAAVRLAARAGGGARAPRRALARGAGPPPEVLLYGALCDCGADPARRARRTRPRGRRRSSVRTGSASSPCGAYARWRRAEAALALGRPRIGRGAAPRRGRRRGPARRAARCSRRSSRSPGAGRVDLGGAAPDGGGRRRRNGSGLTGRELDVLRLVARGARTARSARSCT